MQTLFQLFSLQHKNVFKQTPHLPLNRQESAGRINPSSAGGLGKRDQQNTTRTAESFSGTMGTDFTDTDTNNVHTALLQLPCADQLHLPLLIQRNT